MRSYKDGQAKFNAYLDDYAFFVAALLDLYEATFERHYLDHAVAFTEVLNTRFWDETEGAYFFTSSDHEELISRLKSAFDGAVPSGNSVAVSNLVRLFYLTEKQEYLTKAEKSLRLFYDAMEQNPFSFSNMLCVLDFYLRRPQEIVVVGTAEDPQTQALIAAVHSVFLPHKTLVRIDSHSGGALPTFLQGKVQSDSRATAYVCHDFTCSLPVTEVEALQALLLSP